MKTSLLIAVLCLTAISCSDASNASQTARPPLTSAQEADTATGPAPFNTEKTIDPKAANAAATSFSAASAALLKAYPDFIERIDNNTISFTDGTTMTYDDKRVKDFNTLLDESDVEDMFFVRYDDTVLPPGYLHDAGRSRSEQLFKKMYGNSAAAVKAKLVRVPWFGKNVEFTSVNGAADSLRKVAAEIARHPALRKYLDSSGTFYWRPVRGAKRQSAHSYGIAFDIAVPYSDYWLWKNKGASETSKIVYANRFPQEIVEIFRRYGFIWGGAWYHYDTMHFEFRPEILEYARLTR